MADNLRKMQAIRSMKRPALVVILAGGLSTALGLTVLVGWHTHTTTLLQIHPTFIAMVYNTALAFFLCGGALLAIVLGVPRLAIIGGAYAIVIGLLTLGEITFARDLGIDQLFMRHDVTMANPYPGRMAINSSIFWPLVGTGILAMARRRRFRLRPLLVGLIGSITIAQGLVACSSYLTVSTTDYAWGNLVRMALHTAVGFVVLGAGLLALAWQDHPIAERKVAPRWLPVVVGLAIAAITLCLCQALVSDQLTQAKRTVDAQSALVSNQIEGQLLYHLLAIDRMGRRWHLNGMQDQEHRKADAAMIINDYKGFEGIRWLDASNHIAWTIPAAGHETEVGQSFAFEERRQAVLDAARSSRGRAISRPIELRAGDKGFLILVPVYDGETFQGCIGGFFRIQQLLDAILPAQVTSGYGVVLAERNEEIYRRNGPGEQHGSAWKVSRALNLPGMDWQLEVWPEKKTVAELQSSVVPATLIVGLLISFISAWTVWLAQGASDRSKSLEVTSRELQHEVVERTAAQRALAVASEKEQALFDNALDVLCSVDAEGKFVSVSPACLGLWGYRQEELIGRRFIELVVAEDIPKTNEVAARIINGEPTIDFVNRYQHKDGSEVHTMWSSSWSNGQQLMFAVARNITALKRTEQRLQVVAAELQRSNSELQDFASVASHDLQEPLRKIQAFADELQLSLGEQIGADDRDTMRRMVAAAERMRLLINDLLIFSRVTSKAKPFDPVDLGLTVNEVISDLEARISDTGGRVDVSSMITIDADPLQMRQLLQNLIANGLKFHRPGVAPLIKVSAQNGGSSCRLLIEDNGIGFDEKYLDRIFTVFQRLHGRDEYEGTGIGLAICRKIVERHGGEITARSKPGVGTTFIVTLPVKHTQGED